MFDDGIITLGDGFIAVDGEMVSGSRQWGRDPRLHHATPHMVERLFRREVGTSPINLLPAGTKWCSCYRHRDAVVAAHYAGTLDKTLDFDLAEEGYMPVEYFSVDNRAFDKRQAWCRVCDAARKREAYALRAGRPVRPYARRAE